MLGCFYKQAFGCRSTFTCVDCAEANIPHEEAKLEQKRVSELANLR